jgi:hypothetical protein
MVKRIGFAESGASIAKDFLLDAQHPDGRFYLLD